jgi:hypothetical protein
MKRRRGRDTREEEGKIEGKRRQGYKRRGRKIEEKRRQGNK